MRRRRRRGSAEVLELERHRSIRLAVGESEPNVTPSELIAKSDVESEEPRSKGWLGRNASGDPDVIVLEFFSTVRVENACVIHVFAKGDGPVVGVANELRRGRLFDEEVGHAVGEGVDCRELGSPRHNLSEIDVFVLDDSDSSVDGDTRVTPVCHTFDDVLR